MSQFREALNKKNINYTEDRISEIEEKIDKIKALKAEKDVVVLSHYYMPPELQVPTDEGGIADFTGDSLGLSMAASKAGSPHIVFCGVRFMAETAQILNPGRKVFIPEPAAGCSLAASISASDVRGLKEQYPGVPVVAYVNTYAETKAEVDYCCTSRNAFDIAKSIPGDQLIFVPDYFMGKNLQGRIKEEAGKDMILWDGKCEVHEQFTKESLKAIALENPDAELLLHWEVPDESVRSFLEQGRGMVGSTTDIIKHAGESTKDKFLVGSECDLAATLKSTYPEKEFFSPCIICPHMKSVDIDNTLNNLESINTDHEVNFRSPVEPEIQERALIPLQRMLQFG